MPRGLYAPRAFSEMQAGAFREVLRSGQVYGKCLAQSWILMRKVHTHVVPLTLTNVWSCSGDITGCPTGAKSAPG